MPWSTFRDDFRRPPLYSRNFLVQLISDNRNVLEKVNPTESRTWGDGYVKPSKVSQTSGTKWGWSPTTSGCIRITAAYLGYFCRNIFFLAAFPRSNSVLAEDTGRHFLSGDCLSAQWPAESVERMNIFCCVDCFFSATWTGVLL